MRILAIADTHGRDTWKKYTKDITEFDKVVLLGDYIDSFTLSDKQIIDNLSDLIQFKKDNHDKVELLLGNHCLQYYFLGTRSYMCSGFRQSYADEIHRLFYQNKQLFKAAYQINKGNEHGTTSRWLFTHAGLSRLFLKSLQKRIPDNILKLENKDYATYLNEVFNAIPSYLADVSHYRGGMGNWGGPFWADMREFSKDSYIPGLNMVMGHQPLQHKEEKVFKDGTKLIWVDTESVRTPTEDAVLILDI